MKSWKPGLQDREWGTSQGMPGIVVRDIPLHRPPTEFPGAPGGGRRPIPSPVSDPVRKGDCLHFFQASEFPRVTRRGRKTSELPWRHAPARP